jgi:hypothetical protein
MPARDELSDSADRRGSVRVLRADGEPAPRRGIRIAAITAAALLASAGVLFGTRFLLGAGNAAAGAATPSAELDARSVLPATPKPVSGAGRLVLVGPKVVLDTRRDARPAAGAELAVPLTALPAGASAVLVEVSVVDAGGPGAVTLRTSAGEIAAVRAGRAGAQTSATLLAPLGADGALRVRTEGGGHLVVNLVGAIEPVATATAGRIVPLAATEVVRLVPKSDGKNASFRPADVPPLRAADVAAVLLHISADVGGNGGYVEVGGGAGKLDQKVYWSATSGTDRLRTGFLVVPVTGGPINVHYEAGTRLTAALVGYVTGDRAPDQAAGLVLAAPAGGAEPVTVAADRDADASVVGAMPADRVAAALMTITVTGKAAGAVRVYQPDDALPVEPTLTAGPGAARSTVTLVEAVAGQVRVRSTAEVSVTAVPQAFILAN